MTTGFYLQDNPNVAWPQYGWERAKIGQPGVHLSGAFGVHTTENITDFAGPDYNAEDVARFISERDSWGGYHVVSDYDSIVLLVHPKYAAWADTTNNAHALSVSGSLQAARWLDMTPERRRAVVVNMGKAAAMIALIAVRDGYLAAVPPARRISAQQAIDGTAAGFYGHGETNPGTRYDPGAHFDWNLFLSSYAAAVGGGTIPQSTPSNPALGGLTVADINTISKQLAELLERTKPINVTGGTEDLRDFIAKGTRAAQQAAEQTADINVSGGRQEGIRDFIAKGTRAAQETVARMGAFEAALKAVLESTATPGSPADLEAITKAAEDGAAKALSNLTATVTIQQDAPADAPA